MKIVLADRVVGCDWSTTRIKIDQDQKDMCGTLAACG